MPRNTRVQPRPPRPEQVMDRLALSPFPKTNQLITATIPVPPGNLCEPSHPAPTHTYTHLQSTPPPPRHPTTAVLPLHPPHRRCPLPATTHKLTLPTTTTRHTPLIPMIQFTQWFCSSPHLISPHTCFGVPSRAGLALCADLVHTSPP